MSTGLTTRIEVDAEGVAWIQGANINVIEVVMDRADPRLESRGDPFQHSHLSMAQIHVALAYYYENQDRLDEQIARDLEEVDRMSGENAPSELRNRLNSFRKRR